MSLLGLFSSKKVEETKTDELRRRTKRDTAKARKVVDEKFTHLTTLMGEALRELQLPKQVIVTQHHVRKKDV